MTFALLIFNLLKMLNMVNISGKFPLPSDSQVILISVKFLKNKVKIAQDWFTCSPILRPDRQVRNWLIRVLQPAAELPPAANIGPKSNLSAMSDHFPPHPAQRPNSRLHGSYVIHNSHTSTK